MNVFQLKAEKKNGNQVNQGQKEEVGDDGGDTVGISYQLGYDIEVGKLVNVLEDHAVDLGPDIIGKRFQGSLDILGGIHEPYLDDGTVALNEGQQIKELDINLIDN
jgi:hypothetical protein